MIKKVNEYRDFGIMEKTLGRTMAFEHIPYIHGQGKALKAKYKVNSYNPDPEDLRDKLLVYQSILKMIAGHKTDPIWGIFLKIVYN